MPTEVDNLHPQGTPTDMLTIKGQQLQTKIARPGLTRSGSQGWRESLSGSPTSWGHSK